MPNPQIDLNQSTFDEAITYFRQKTAIPTQKWDDLQDEEHDWAFTIAKLTKANLLQDAQELIEKAIQEGKSSDEFKDEFKKKIESKGWVAQPLPAGPDDYRYRIIFETNVLLYFSSNGYLTQYNGGLNTHPNPPAATGCPEIE